MDIYDFSDQEENKNELFKNKNKNKKRILSDEEKITNDCKFYIKNDGEKALKLFKSVFMDKEIVSKTTFGEIFNLAKNKNSYNNVFEEPTNIIDMEKKNDYITHYNKIEMYINDISNRNFFKAKKLLVINEDLIKKNRYAKIVHINYTMIQYVNNNNNSINGIKLKGANKTYYKKIHKLISKYPIMLYYPHCTLYNLVKNIKNILEYCSSLHALQENKCVIKYPSIYI